MTRWIIVLMCMLFAQNIFAQSDYDRAEDETGAVVFKGQFGFDDLLKEPSFSWMQNVSSGYKPDTVAIKYLKKHLKDYEMVVFLGTWCTDSHDMIPKLYKTLQSSVLPKSFAMYGVDRAKEAKYVAHKLYRIDLVPVVILVQDHREVGRITEAASESIEKDLQQMIEQDLIQKQ